MIGVEGNFFLVNGKTGKHTGPFTRITDAWFARDISDGSWELMDYKSFNNYINATTL